MLPWPGTSEGNVHDIARTVPSPDASLVAGLAARDLRWLADAYEQAQRVRVDTGERIRAILQGRDARRDVTSDVPDPERVLAAIRKGEEDGPVPLLGRTFRRHAEEERELQRAMREAVATHPAWPWLSRVKGVGVTLAAKLLARLDVTRAPAPSSFWAYCGLATVPGIEYRCATCGLRASFPERYRVKGTHSRPGTSHPCDGSLVPHRGPETGIRVAQPRPAAGERAAYDMYAKKVCYLIGVSFLRSRSTYGAYYRTQRERMREERPGWTQGRIHFAALRKTEKLFLAHLWLVWRTALALPTIAPYAHAVLGRDEYFPPEAMIENEAIQDVEP